MPSAATPAPPPRLGLRHVGRRSFTGFLVIGVVAFLTLVDLFAVQAILPTLARVYGVAPAAMGTAVNACTLGMAVAALLIALFGSGIDSRRGVVASLALLSVPTALLAVAPDLGTFTVLRVAQGVFMSAAFTFTATHLSERSMNAATASALAAYVTGNVASNLAGRIVAAAAADHWGLPVTFLIFAGLNVTGALLVLRCFDGGPRTLDVAPRAPARIGPAVVLDHLRVPELRSALMVGFLILFAFLGVFTYVNFVLVRSPIGLDPMSLGLVYLVFLPSLVSTLLAGALVALAGHERALFVALAAALAGLLAVAVPSLLSMLIGLALVAAGTFAAQAIVAGAVGRITAQGRPAANGLYLAAYYSGGLAGSVVVGAAFDAHGWNAAVLLVAAAVVGAAVIGRRIMIPGASA